MRVLKKISPVITIVLLWLEIIVANHSPGTILSGWDNLHPEFRFGLNIKRSLFAAWQEYQGLGLLGGMGHAADLFRQILLWFFSFIIPVSFLRYFFHFLMLLLGPLGVYFLLKQIILFSFKKEEKELGSLGGAIFYLFNLATLQMFYVPFEPFSAHFAALPWLFWAIFKYLKESSKKNLLIFIFINLLSVCQGYVATIFLVYLLALGLFFLSYFLFNRQSLKKILILCGLTFLLNAFWLLPNLYFVVRDVETNLGAKINLMATSDNFLKNQKYGNLANVAPLKGFWFDNVEINAKGIPNYQMGSWMDHFKKPWFLTIGYFLFGASFLGVIFAFLKKNWPVCLFVAPLFLGFTVLANNTFGFSTLAKLFHRLPLFWQIFRFPFTKFSILVAFCWSMFFAVFVLFLSQKVKTKYLRLPLLVLLLALPIFYLYPIFQGKLFYFKEKSDIPQEYFQVFDFFKSRNPNSRIANFPQNSFWGWTFYQWNYSGSGFLWYGIEQPILDRAFDVWSKKNENYYWEISYAIYSRNQKLFELVLDKYQINWLLVDESVINLPGYKGLGLEELQEIISNSNRVDLVQSFGKIKIYQVSSQTPVGDFVFLAQDLPGFGPNYSWTNLDQAFLEQGNYFSQPKPDIFYPFRSLFTGRDPRELDFEIRETEKSYIFRKELPREVADYKLKLPENVENELIWINPEDLNQVRYLTPKVDRKENNLEVIVPKVGGYLSSQINPIEDKNVLTAQNCNHFSLGKVENQAKEEFLNLSATDANNCSPIFHLENLLHKFGYLIRVESRNIAGKSLLFWLENLTAKRADMELYLPKSGGVTYLIQPKAPENSTLVLSQAYHPGWKAYWLANKRYPLEAFLAPIFGQEIKDHVLVNNWENGWNLDSLRSKNEKLKIVIIFLPQYLEYLGLGILPMTFFLVLFNAKNE